MWNASSWDSSYLWDQLSRYDKDNMCYEFRRGLCEDDAARCDICGSRIASGLCNGCILAEDKPRQGDAVAAALHFASENAELKKIIQWIYNDGAGREVWPNNLDGSDSEQFLEIKRLSQS
jgi:hypothetical protein